MVETISDIKTPVGGESVMDETARAMRILLVDADGDAVEDAAASTVGAPNALATETTINTIAAQVFPARLTRRSGIISNLEETDGTTVYIGTSADVTGTARFRLLAGTSMPWPSTAAVWAVAAEQGGAAINFLEFYND